LIGVGRALVLFAAAVLLSQVEPALAQSGVPEGSIGIRLLEVPTSLHDDPRAHLYIIDHLAQGETIHRRIEVSSGLAHRERITLYAAGASISAGRFHFFPDETPDELSTWITVTPASLDLEPQGSGTAVVTIAVPADTTDAERYAVVWAETPPSRPPGGGLAAVNRVGIRVYLSVGRGPAPPIGFRIESLTALRDRSGRPVVSAMVANTGGRAVDLGGELRLTHGPGGLSAGPFPVELGTTLGIGQRAPVRVLLDPAIPDGPWTARLTLRSDLVERSASARITFPRVAGTQSSPVPATSGSGFFGSIVAIVAIGIAVAAALWLLFFVRRRRDRREPIRGGK
jgi:hypothetical protein